MFGYLEPIKKDLSLIEGLLMVDPIRYYCVCKIRCKKGTDRDPAPYTSQ